MNLREQVLQFLQTPYPLWENALTRRLVKCKWDDLRIQGFSGPVSYNTASIWLNNSSLTAGEKKCISQSDLCLEMLSADLKSFYEENGLELLSKEEIEESGALLKLSKAVSVLQLIKPAYNCITDLVCTIQILRQPEPEVDLSYSHPQIPFSIFVSLCEDDSLISSLRVAESILHEAMHLKLTLIESIIPLVKTEVDVLQYSPWKDEERPTIGILHGLFVFSAISAFYAEISQTKKLSTAEGFFTERCNQITDEIIHLKNFATNFGLTEAGASLVRNLLPSH